jgi:plastocyanin domain-containing protein
MSSNVKTLLVIGALALGAFLLFREGGQSQTTTTTDTNSNVTMVSDQQIVVIGVKGGYSPQTSTVKAGVPTVLRFTTNGSYDCSSSVRIPDLGINKNLPATGTTDVNIDTLAAGTIKGTCSMGMYTFEINAQ